ncbi:MAG: putative beta-lysine N-acetyltransferase [Calditrichae bacterium]|nr:putative beta-lysine N-acetyltransferase [Calditrichia bacterium]
MYDKIEKLGNSTIQHGKQNKRIYLMKLDKKDFPAIVKELELIAAHNFYTKIFAKIPDWALEGFLQEGYLIEAHIPKFYNGDNGVFFVSQFVDHSRSAMEPQLRNKIEDNIGIAKSKQNGMTLLTFPENLKIRQLSQRDTSNLAEIYKDVFDSYPFPIFEEEYLEETMDSHIDYFGAFINNDLVAASSAEMDKNAKNAEMTDFATLPDYRGNNLSMMLLKEMEALMRSKKMKTVYTIARALSTGMNVTFSKMNYVFAGTLINNTNIAGKIESMNVWYKNL